jgi:hypothetical protein
MIVSDLARGVRNKNHENDIHGIELLVKIGEVERVTGGCNVKPAL